MKRSKGPRTGFTPDPWYNPERDGTLTDYFRVHDGITSTALFKGYDDFKLLWNEGYLVPNMSYIRLMWNVGREDEHFRLVSKSALEGIAAPAHAGRPGVFDPEKILSEGPAWEAGNLRRRPKKRIEDLL